MTVYPARRPLRRYAAFTAAVVMTLLLLIAALAESRFGIVIPTLRSPAPFTSRQAGGFFVVDPSSVADLAPDLLAPEIGHWPAWVVRRVLPYEAGGATILDMDGRRIAVSGYLNSRRLAPVIARAATDVDLGKAAPEIFWAGRAHEIAPGMLVAQGSFPFDPDAEQSFATMWDAKMSPAPLAAEGGHFVEAVIDNRRGHGYLIFASVLRAYHIDLAKNQHEISLSSMQFVREARFTMDLARPDTFRIKLVLDIVPEAIDRLGVVNLKVGIEGTVKDLADRWHADLGLDLMGAGRWDGSKIVYEYQLKSARKFLELIRDGQLH